MSASPTSHAFTTADLHLAAFLIASGARIANPVILSEKKVLFCFEDGPRCSELAMRFVRGEDQVSARALIESQGRARDVRDMALSARRAQ